MCSYKLVTVKFEVWGLQTRVEQFVHKVSGTMVSGWGGVWAETQLSSPEGGSYWGGSALLVFLFFLFKGSKHHLAMMGAKAFSSLILPPQVVRDVLLLGHRQAFAWVDEWIGRSCVHLHACKPPPHPFSPAVMNDDETQLCNIMPSVVKGLTLVFVSHVEVGCQVTRLTKPFVLL